MTYFIPLLTVFVTVPQHIIFWYHCSKFCKAANILSLLPICLIRSPILFIHFANMVHTLCMENWDFVVCFARPQTWQTFSLAECRLVLKRSLFIFLSQIYKGRDHIVCVSLLYVIDTGSTGPVIPPCESNPIPLPLTLSERIYRLLTHPCTGWLMQHPTPPRFGSNVFLCEDMKNHSLHLVASPALPQPSFKNLRLRNVIYNHQDVVLWKDSSSAPRMWALRPAMAFSVLFLCAPAPNLAGFFKREHTASTSPGEADTPWLASIRLLSHFCFLAPFLTSHSVVEGDSSDTQFVSYLNLAKDTCLYIWAHVLCIYT